MKMKFVYLALLLLAPFRASAELDKVSFQMNYLFSGQHAGFAYGVVKGIYAAEGLDVQLLEGAGSTQTAMNVATEKGPRFGQASSPVLIETSQEGVKVISIAQLLYTNPACLLVTEESGIRTGAQLKGKRVGHPEKSAPRSLMPIYLKLNGLSTSDIKDVVAPPAELFKLLAAGKIDAFGYLTTIMDGAEKIVGKRLVALPFAAGGVPILGDALIINTKYMKDAKDRSINCRMARATSKAMEEAGQHPEEAVDALMKLFPTADKGEKKAALNSWVKSYNLSKTRASMNKPAGYNFPDDWPKMISLMQSSNLVSKVHAPTDYYTNEFIDCK